MKTMTRLLLVLSVMLAVGVAASAQTYAVEVETEEDAAIPVAKALKARIGASSSRYTVVDSEKEMQILVALNCFELTGQRGYACNSSISIWPDSTAPFHVDLGSYLSKGPDAVTVAENLFQDFVSDTSAAKIDAAVKAFLRRVGLFCQQDINKKHCKRE
jgi:hypothetical protein